MENQDHEIFHITMVYEAFILANMQQGYLLMSHLKVKLIISQM